MDRRSFLKIFAMLFGGTALAAYIRWNPNKNDFDPGYIPQQDEDSIYVKHIDIHLVEHCNLKCKYCSHFSSIAEKHFYNVEQYEKDMKQLAYVTKGRVSEIQLTGGETLLHPEIVKLINITRYYFPESNISILTNGILLNTMKNDFWKACSSKDICLTPTIYPIKIDWEPVFEKSQKYNVPIKVSGTEVKLNKSNLGEHITNYFLKLKLDTKGRQNNINRYNECPHHTVCTNFVDGKLYPCPVVSNIKHFNKKFNKNIPVTDKDFIDIYKTTHIKELVDFLNTPIPFCKYCKISYKHYKWEIGKQDISEWT